MCSGIETGSEAVRQGVYGCLHLSFSVAMHMKQESCGECVRLYVTFVHPHCKSAEHTGVGARPCKRFCTSGVYSGFHAFGSSHTHECAVSCDIILIITYLSFHHCWCMPACRLYIRQCILGSSRVPACLKPVPRKV